MPPPRRRNLGVGACCLMLVACSGAVGESAPASTDTSASTSTTITVPVPTSTTKPSSGTTNPGTTNPGTTSSSTTSTVPVELDPSVVALVPDRIPCTAEWAPPLGIDELTFARDGNIFTVDPSTGTLHCLASLDHDPTLLDWNPAGDRLLIDGDLVLTESGIHPSGFAADTTGISWSQPQGSALIAPSSDGASLVHVNADNPTDVTDVSSLAVTWAAAYHPSGLAIISAGVSDEGQSGLFIADNHGDDPRPLVVLDDPSTSISEVVVAHNGDWIAFVHDHSASTQDDPVMAHVHRLFLPFLGLDDLATYPDVVPTGLVASEQADGRLGWTTTYTAERVETSVMAEDAALDEFQVDQVISTPVGFLDVGTAAMLVRPVATTSTDVWLYPEVGDPVLMVRAVTAAATRTVHDPNWTEPPLDIEQRAVG